MISDHVDAGAFKQKIVINSDPHHAAGKGLDTIDDVAEELTGDRRRFTPVLRC